MAGTQQPHTGRSLLRSPGQNDIFHAWCRVIAILAMSTKKYKKTEADLTRADHDSKFISMSQLLGNMEAWAATDLDGLILPREIKE